MLLCREPNFWGGIAHDPCSLTCFPVASQFRADREVSLCEVLRSPASNREWVCRRGGRTRSLWYYSFKSALSCGQPPLHPKGCRDSGVHAPARTLDLLYAQRQRVWNTMLPTSGSLTLSATLMMCKRLRMGLSPRVTIKILVQVTASHLVKPMHTSTVHYIPFSFLNF